MVMTRTRRLALGAALAALAAAFAAFAALRPTEATSADPGTAQEDFELMQMVHTTEPATNPAAGPPIPWDGDSPGLYRYNSRDCRENAPVNNISTNLVSYNSRYGRSPASTRSQPFEIEVVHGNSAEESRLQGRITLIVCKEPPNQGSSTDAIPDAARNKVFIEFTAAAEEDSREEVHYEGPFHIVGGTGVYEDMKGGGRIHGYFMCLQGQCAGENYRDGQYSLTGFYNDPTPPPTASSP